jgi:DNA adenine methylase
LGIDRINLVVKKDKIELCSDSTILASATLQSKIKPIVKWAGGKQWLAAGATSLAPQGWRGRYFEPFAGGASFFFSLQPARAVLGDSNRELITTYGALKDDAESVIDLLDDYSYDKEFFYYLRGTSPRASHAIAARFLYLNRSCWNGLYRVNRRGRFNTPFGDFTNPTILDEDRLTDAVALLKRAALRLGDFGSTLRDVKPDDFVYCDPPYIIGHQNNGFVKYNAHLFSWEDQVRLAKLATLLKKKGANILISNADHQKVVELYKGFNLYSVVRRSSISGDPESRTMTKEVLLSSYKIMGHGSEVV